MIHSEYMHNKRQMNGQRDTRPMLYAYCKMQPVSKLTSVKQFAKFCGNSHAMWYHSVTCHPAEETFMTLPQHFQLEIDLANPRGMQG